VNDQTLSSEESLLPNTLCSINNLIGNNEMSRFNFLSEGSDGGKGNDGLDSDML
jgi:hypothetical protein